MTIGSDKDRPLIRIEKIREMLFDEEKYVIEFAEASIESFSEYSRKYSRFLLERDKENFQRAGHKIKPVAKILELEQILVEYRKGKLMLEEEETEEKLIQSVHTVQEVCDTVISEFQGIIRQLQ